MIFNITDGAPSKNDDKKKLPVGEACVVSMTQLFPFASQTYRVYGADAPLTEDIVIFEAIM
jgi:hypothetical protein